MRGGYFLAEESPEKLLTHFGAETLEDVFLKLSVMQNMGRRRRSSILQEVADTIRVPSGAVNEAVIVDDNEMSGEFGDNVSIGRQRVARRVSLVPEGDNTDVQMVPELPPDEDPPVK